MPIEFKMWDTTPLMLEGEKAPTLKYFKTSKKDKNKGCVLIFPGGAYRRVMTGYEGAGYAEFLNQHGLDAFVLDYRVKPYKFPVPLLEARRAIRIIRNNAKELGIDENKVLVIGSSAGGHLAALLCTYKGKIDGEGVDEIDEINPTPNGQILCYPVIDPNGHPESFLNLLGERECYDGFVPSNLCDENTPPVFMWHTMSDESVNVLNTLSYARALKERGVSCEMHLFPNGKHGLGLADEEALQLREENRKIGQHVNSWNGILVNWLSYMGFID